MTAPRIAYYAPMKAPTHPTPSGDRAMAQSLMGLLERGRCGGHARVRAAPA